MWGDTIIYLNHLKRKPINKEKNEFSKYIKCFVKFKLTLFLTYVKNIHQKIKMYSCFRHYTFITIFGSWK